MGCSCSREGEVCLRQFCDGQAACCAAPCEASSSAAAAPARSDGDELPQWLSSGQAMECAGSCLPRAAAEQEEPGLSFAEPRDAQPAAYCPTGGSFSYDTDTSIDWRLLAVMLLAAWCAAVVYCKQRRVRKQMLAAKPMAVQAVLVQAGDLHVPPLVALAMPAQPATLVGGAVEAVSVVVEEGAPPAATRV